MNQVTTPVIKENQSLIAISVSNPKNLTFIDTSQVRKTALFIKIMTSKPVLQQKIE